MLQNEYSLANFGFDTAENEPLKVWGYVVWGSHPPNLGVNQPSKHLSGGGRAPEDVRRGERRSRDAYAAGGVDEV